MERLSPAIVFAESADESRVVELGPITRLGRTALRVPDELVGKRHATIRRLGERFTIEAVARDVLVNGKRLKSAPLGHGDWITFGHTTVVFRGHPTNDLDAFCGGEALSRAFALRRALDQLDAIADPERFLAGVVSTAATLLSCLKASVSGIHVSGVHGERLWIDAAHGWPKREWEKVNKGTVGARFLKRVIETRRAVLAPDVRLLGFRPYPRFKTKSCLVVPTINEKDQAVGAIAVADRTDGEPFSIVDERVLQVIASRMGPRL